MFCANFGAQHVAKCCVKYTFTSEMKKTVNFVNQFVLFVSQSVLILGPNAFLHWFKTFCANFSHFYANYFHFYALFSCQSSSLPTLVTEWVIHHSSFRAINAAIDSFMLFWFFCFPRASFPMITCFSFHLVRLPQNLLLRCSNPREIQ